MDLAPTSAPAQPGVLTVLGLESSCDESAAAVLRRHEDGRIEVLSDLVLGQTEAHAPFGGVVPEIAARAHAERLAPMIAATLADAGMYCGVQVGGGILAAAT